jgi:hypothetical protein
MFRSSYNERCKNIERGRRAEARRWIAQIRALRVPSPWKGALAALV